ncbi:MAG: bifunctional acetate--CoA ligase family protein/GNAT family N-acetyltransferase [Thermodesulfobacteriota bacterium]|nr:bifunctional acetate--CoA ligase family protein/GNAT family N-acetyltransferase [Thermodesulfobacteriota bacterium]
MSIHNMDKIFKPSSVAVIGASDKEGSVGYSLITNIIEGGYKGKVFAINPNLKSIKDIVCYPSVLEIDEPVDLAVIAVPITKVPYIARECVQVGVRSAVILSAGGKETGPEGKKLEDQIKIEAGRGDLRIIGPNCFGIASAESSLKASFARFIPLTGNLAFVSQSGGICASILDLSVKEGIGFRYFASVGSVLDVDFGDLINYLGNDKNVTSLILYIENLTNIRKFMSAARAVSRVKPIAVLKAGKSVAGAQAASSHTGAMTGEDAVYNTAFKRAGIVRVDTVQELFDCAELMAKQPVPSGEGVGIITNGGGPGVMATDALAAYDIEPVVLAHETIQKLDDILPPFWSKGNPIDILGDASPEVWQRTIDVCISAREINALVIIFIPQALSNPLTIAQSIVKLLQNRRHPLVFAVWMGGESVDQCMRILNRAGIPTYETPERAITALLYMYSYKRNLEMLHEIPPKLEHSLELDRSSAKAIIRSALEKGDTFLTEVESKALLEAYRIPVNTTELARSPDEASRLAQKIGYPVAMKICSREIVHKSDVCGVQLNLRNDQEVKNAFLSIVKNARKNYSKAIILGASVQKMLQQPDYELILGSKKDPDFGPVILFGMGGIMTEILKDTEIALPPLNRLLARRLMEKTKIYRILKGYRNRPPAPLAYIEEILIRISHLVTDFPEIVELDINPMILYQNVVCAVDARVLIHPSSITTPHHLVISPYPNQYETRVKTKGGVDIFIRPIRPEDAPLLVELFDSLSPRTIYYRFFSPMKSISHDMLVRFTQIDYDRDMAIVAIAIENTQRDEKMLGVARLIGNIDGLTAEFAVVITDPLQGKGIGTALIERLIVIAKERGIRTLTGLVLKENRNMIALGKKLGFIVKRAEDFSQCELNIDLTSIP